MIGADLLSGLAQMSARIGADRLLIQGPGGNSSIKDGEELWVKASGQWLAEAEARPIFVPLAVSRLCDDYGELLAEAPFEAVVTARNPVGLKPSIETMLHAIMPHPVVVHAHAVNTMAVSVLADGESRAVERLSGLRWRWIPYHRPGAPLARAVGTALAEAPADVLILQNHGLVIGAEDFARAEALLADVEHCLALPAREAPPEGGAMAGDDGFEPHPLASLWARDAAAADVLTRFTLLPDQVVFLGGPMPLWHPDETPSAAAARAEAATGISPAILMRPGQGAVAARGRTGATEAMIEGLIEVARRLPPGAEISALSIAHVAELAGWDAEQYRRNIDAVRG